MQYNKHAFTPYAITVLYYEKYLIELWGIRQMGDKNTQHKEQPIEFRASEWLDIPGLPIATDNSQASHPSPGRMAQAKTETDPTFLPHRHDWTELVVILRGKAVHHIGGRAFNVSCGDIFVVHSNVVHYFSDAEDLDASDIYFIPEKLPLPLALLQQIPGFNMLMYVEPSMEYPDEFKSRLFLTGQQLAELKNMVDSLTDELSWRANGFGAAAVNQLTEILLFLGRNYSQGQEEMEKGWLSRLDDALILMERKHSGTVTVEEMAKAANTSLRNFQRIFKEVMKMRPLEYLNRLRLKHAAEMLVSSDMQVTNIAFSCGFNDLAHFGQCFRAQYGESPLKYRQRMRSIDDAR